MHRPLNKDCEGFPMDPETRCFMEIGFGYDFSDVRIHIDRKAADAMGARAFASGNRIVFNEGEYAPHTPEGRRLLAHELAHVVQQRTARSILNRAGIPGDSWEQEADEAADLVCAGKRAQIHLCSTAPGVQCNPQFQLPFPTLGTSVGATEPQSPWRFNLGSASNPRPSSFHLREPETLSRRPRLFSPTHLSLQLQPPGPGCSLMPFTVPSRGVLRFSREQCGILSLMRAPRLRFVPMAGGSSALSAALLGLTPGRGEGNSTTPRPAGPPPRDNVTVDTGSDFALSGDGLAFELWVALVLQADAAHLGSRIDLGHQLTGQTTIGVPVAGGGDPYLAFSLALTLINFHIFQDRSGNDLLELGLGQTGLSDQNGVLSFQEAAVLEGHVTRNFSILATGGFNLRIDRTGIDAHPAPFFNLGVVRHF